MMRRSRAVGTIEILHLLTDATFRGLLDSAPDGMLVVGPDGRILVVNSQIEELFGYSRDELVGESPEILVPDELKRAHAAHRAGYGSRPTIRRMGSGLSLKGRRKDGSDFRVEISLSPRVTPDGTLIVAAVRDITERLRLEAAHGALLEATQAQNERERIAMDLHDGIIQSIFGVALGLEIAAEEARDTPAEPLIERSIEQLNDVIRDIRGYIFELRPASYDGDLADSLRHLAGSFRASSSIVIDLQIDGDLSDADDSVDMAIFQIAQEALANVRRHSQAKRVDVRLRRVDDRVVAQVTDDGVGFDAAAERAEEHRGLRNLARRAASVGGRLDVESAAGRGTTISVSIPAGETFPRERLGSERKH